MEARRWSHRFGGKTKHVVTRRRDDDMAPGKLWLIAVLAVGAAAPQEALAQAVSTPPASNPAVDIEQLSALLFDASATAAQRDEAARRLVSRHTPQAVQVLGSALSDPRNPEARLAAARALAR